MANVLNRLTMEYLTSVNTPDYPTVDWVLNPDLDSVQNVPVKYWKITGDVVSEMDQAEKDIVDALLLPGIKLARKDYLRNRGDDLIASQGYTTEIKQNLLSVYSDSIKIKPNKSNYLQPWMDWLNQINVEVKIKQDAVDAATTINTVNEIELDSVTLIAADPHKSVSGSVAVVDTLDLSNFLNANAVVTDPDTGVKGPFYLMQELQHRKDLYNDSENPIYKAGHTPILGSGGILVDHASRVSNLEDIHDKMAWHGLQVRQALYKKPKDLLVYYGYLNSFNSAQNGWDNEKVAQDMAKYSMFVFGDTVESPAHPDYANTQIIISRLKILNPNALIFGYVSLNQSLVDFQTKTDQWNTLGVHGIFIDEAGYDYGKTRAEFNTCVTYVHGKLSANLCFANAWNTDNVLGVENDASYPNATFNPGLVESALTQDDWILLESFPINTTAYVGTGGYESKDDWLARGDKAVALRASYGVNFAGLGIINNDSTVGMDLFNFGYISALMYSLEAFGTSDSSYASASASVFYWTRQNISGNVYEKYPSVSVSPSDADAYLRRTELVTLLLDFSTGAQLSFMTNGANGSTSWKGAIVGAWATGDPSWLIDNMLCSPVNATPTNISVSVARCSLFKLDTDLVVNKIRFLGLSALTNVYRVAIYRLSDLARLTAELPFITAAQTWGSAGSALAITLKAGVIYFVAVAVNATGTSAGVQCFSGTTGRIGVLPTSWPGNLNVNKINSKINTLGFCQFAVTTGALPNPVASLSAQAAWTGGMPAMFLDNNNA